MAILGGGIISNSFNGSGSGGGGSVITGGATTFLALTDTPATYTGQAYKVVRVKSNESGLEFIASDAGTYVVFKENFVGNGVSNTFTLNGTIQNGSFLTGSWNISNIQNTLPANITDNNGNPIYDGNIYFFRHRINVTGIDGSAHVTLDYIPQNLANFSIWYWYKLGNGDKLQNYYREDFVASMESAVGGLATQVYTNTTNFNNILGASDTTVQLALDTLDNIGITKTDVAAISSGLNSRLNNINILAGNAITVNKTYDNVYTINSTSRFSPIAGNGISIVTNSPSSATFNVQDYISKTESSSISAYLQNQITQNVASISGFSTNYSYILNSIGSGIISGGILSINSNPMLFNVSAGSGVIVDDWTNPIQPVVYPVSWSDTNGISGNYITTNFVTWIAIDKNSNIVQLINDPNNNDRRDYIVLGKLAHYTKIAINAISPRYTVAASPLEQYRDYLQTFNLINLGVTIYPNGANLNINNSSGNVFGRGINYISNPKNPHQKNINAQSPVTFQYRLQNGTAYSNTITIDPNNYDNNGVLTSIPGNNNTTNSTNQRVYLFSTGNIRLQYGQQVYASLSDAIAGIQFESFNTYQAINDDAVLIGIISIRKNATDLTNTLYARFIPVSRYGDTIGGAAGISTTSLQSAYNNSIVPQITTNTALDGLVIKRGSDFDSDKLFYLQNGNGDNVFVADGLGSLTLASLSGSNTNIVTHNSNGLLTDSGISVNSLTPISTTQSISANLQNQINAITILKGKQSLNNITDTYSVSHSNVNILSSYIQLTLEIPSNNSTQFPVSVNNRQSTSFDIVTSTIPPVTGYSVYWQILN